MKKEKHQVEKTDWTALLKVNLPLSEKTYIKLGIALTKGHLKWTDLPNELKVAYGSYGAEERARDWQEGVDAGKWRWWQ